MKIWWLIIFCLITLTSRAQDSVSVARLRSLKGVVASFASIEKRDSLLLIFFWSVNSDESISALNTINADLEKWRATVPFRFLAVSVDEGKTANKLRPTYNMNSWTFEVYLDLYGDLRRALHSNNMPQAMILSGKHMVYEQSGYSPGSENYLLNKLVEIYRQTADHRRR